MLPGFRRVLATVAAAAAACLAVSSNVRTQAPTGPRLRVVATTPNGAIAAAVTQASVRFSEPMVALAGAEADSAAIAYVTVSPAIDVSYHWPDTNVLVIAPRSGRFPRASRITITVAAGATATSGRRLAAAHAFTFDTAAPRLTGATLEPRVDAATKQPAGSYLRLAFDAPVRVSDVLARIDAAYMPAPSPVPALSAPARARMARVDPQGLGQRDAWAGRIAARLARRQSLRVTLAPHAGDSAPAVLLLLPESPPPGARIAVTARGVGSSEGPLRRTVRDRVVTTSPPPFTISGPDCLGACQPALAALTATRSATVQALRAALVVTDITNPSAERVVEPTAAPGWLSWSATLRDLGYRLVPGHRYAARIDGSLQDDAGHRLGAPWMSVFDVELPASVVGLATAGPAVWEAANGPRLPVISRSLRDVRTRVTAIAPGDAPALQAPEAGQAHASAAPTVTEVAMPVDGSEQETLVDVSSTLSAKGTGIVRFSVDGGREAQRRSSEVVTVSPLAYTTSTILQVTNIGVTVRGNADRLAILATRLDTGDPIAGASIRIVDRTSADLWRGRTGADGLVVTPAVAGATLLLVEHDGDAAYAAATSGWHAGGMDRAAIVGVLFTDRGVYRPGETAQVKAFLQTATPSGLEPLPAGTSITLEVERPGIDDETYEAAIGPAGGIEWTVPIPADAKVDEPTWLSVKRTDVADDWSMVQGSLLVKAVKPVEFQTTLEASEIRTGDQPALTARVEARDLSDVALSGAVVAWTVTREPIYPLAQILRDDPDFVYQTSDDDVEAQFDEDDGKPFRREDRDELDALGTRAARFELPSGLAGRGRFTVAAQITDTSSQVLGQRRVVAVEPDAYLGVGHDDAALAARVPAVAVVARTAAGGHVPGIPVRVRVVRAGAADDDPGAVELDAMTGPAPVRVVLPEPFRNVEVSVTVRAADRARAVMPTDVILNPGGGTPALPPSPDVTPDVTLALDRERYQPRDRARLAIATAKGYATALVTLERGAVLEAHAVRLDGGSASLDLPVGDSAVSGLQAVVTAIRGRTSPCCAKGRDDPGRPTVYTAAVDVPLDRAAAELKVAIEAPETRRPGERAVVTVRVRDHRDRPVQGEVTIWAVDEGLLALTNYAVPSPFAAMYERGPEWVGFSDSRTQLLRRSLPEYIGELLQTSASQRSDTLAIGSVEAGDLDARRDFRPLAFWHGAVSTDADGVARIEAALPDTLTTYRVIAIAAASGARFGGARAPITVAKPLMVRPALPRFMTRLDRAQIRVSVAAGRLSGRGTVAVESLTPALLRVAGEPQRVDVTEGGRALVAFSAEARGEGLARVRIVATVGGERDVVEKDLPIVDAVVMETSAAVGDAEPDAVEMIRLPAAIEREAGQLDVELASTMLVGLAASGDYVAAYPYACAEQTASRALVLVLAAAIGPSFTLTGGAVGDAPRRDAAQAAIDRLEAYHCDGGYGYWKGDCGLRSPYLSAYVLFVLETARRHGFTVDQALLTRDARELEGALARRPAARPGFDDSAWRAFAAKVLVDAGRRPTASLDALYAARETLPVFALAHLLDATAAIDADSPRVAELRRRIRNALTVGATAHVEEKTLAAYTWCWPSNPKSTAVVLDVLARRGGLSADEARPIVSWLIGERGRAGIWSGTQDNVWGLVGLAAYQRAFEPRRGPITASAALESTELLTQTLDLRQPLVSRRMAMADVAGIVPPGGSGRLTVKATGSGAVFYTTRLSVARPAREVEPLSHGITLSRRYLPVVAGRNGRAATTFAPGDLVRVMLTVRVPEDRSFIAVSDPLPAGLEVADTSLATAAPDAAEAGDDHAGFRWWHRGFDRIERRDQRVDLFATMLPGGEYEVSYLARAVTPGTFFAAPTRAEAMYQPEVAGRGPGATVTVTSK